MIGTNGKLLILGELIRGLSIGLAETGEWDLGDVLATKLKRCIATAEWRWPVDDVDGCRRKTMPSFKLTESDGADLPNVEFLTRTRFDTSAKII